MLASFAVHDARAAAAPEKGVAAVLAGCLAEMGHLLAGRDVVRPDQGVEERHWLEKTMVFESRATLRRRALCVERCLFPSSMFRHFGSLRGRWTKLSAGPHSIRLPTTESVT